MSDMSDKQTPIGFIEKYASISDMDTTQVISLLDIQDKQDTKYSRVKTCLELWNAATEATRSECDDKIKAMQTEIDKRDEELLDLRMDKLLLNLDNQRVLVNDLPYLCKRFGFSECLANLATRNGTPRIQWIAKLIEDLELDVKPARGR